MKMEGTNLHDGGSQMPMQTDDDRNKDPRIHMIRAVQHLIERCLLFQMDLHDCVETLEKHAKIHPALTIAVWKGLLKENREFFDAYPINSARSHNPPPAPPDGPQ